MTTEAPLDTTRPSRLPLWLGLILLVIALDQASKWIVMDRLAYGLSIPVLPFFKLVHVLNTGAAFSFLSDQSGWQRWFFVIIGTAICAWLLFLLSQHLRDRLLCAACSLIIGGALGNIMDRLIHGGVVDFLYFYIGRFGWPAFNLADSAITLGVILMLWSQLMRKNPSDSPENTPS